MRGALTEDYAAAHSSRPLPPPPSLENHMRVPRCSCRCTTRKRPSGDTDWGSCEGGIGIDHFKIGICVADSPKTEDSVCGITPQPGSKPLAPCSKPRSVTSANCAAGIAAIKRVSANAFESVANAIDEDRYLRRKYTFAARVIRSCTGAPKLSSYTE